MPSAGNSGFVGEFMVILAAAVNFARFLDAATPGAAHTL
jgi:hypothetical protein